MRKALLCGLFAVLACSLAVAQINQPGGGGGSGTVSANNGQTNVIATYAAAGGSTTVGPAASTNPSACMPGATSGEACLTPPAIAGTPANPILFGNAISWTTGLGAITHIQSPSDQGLVIFAPNGRSVNLEVSSANAQIVLDNAAGNRFYPATNNQIVNGISGGFSWKSTSSIAYLTDTNCAAVGTAANPSVASCTAAAAGSFSCATNASTGTCTVNTTAVTANSEIFVTQRTDTTTGTRLSVTCNTTIDTVQRAVTAVTAATSFTINLGTITTNPECFSYYIIN